jgi:flagellar operon protein
MTEKLLRIKPINILKENIQKKESHSVVKEQCSFEEALNQVQKVKFSTHALSRIAGRKIELSEEQMKSLNQAVEKAENKGAKESLILLNDLAFVVSVKNKTVITALEKEKIKEGVFTNIDSAVII